MTFFLFSWILWIFLQFLQTAGKHSSRKTHTITTNARKFNTLLWPHFHIEPFDLSSSPTGSDLFYCMICGKRFVKQFQLKMHMPTHEHENNSIECYLCSSKFDRLHGLRIHFAITHRAKRNLRCTICDKTFSKQQDLELHIRVVSWIQLFIPKPSIDSSGFSHFH